MLRLFFNTINKQSIEHIKIFGPIGIRNKTQEICQLANGVNHPLKNWINDNIKFIEINSNDQIELDNDILIKIFPMEVLNPI
jgi:hypothetical protein